MKLSQFKIGIFSVVVLLLGASLQQGGGGRQQAGCPAQKCGICLKNGQGGNSCTGCYKSGLTGTSLDNLNCQAEPTIENCISESFILHLGQKMCSWCKEGYYVALTESNNIECIENHPGKCNFLLLNLRGEMVCMSCNNGMVIDPQDKTRCIPGDNSLDNCEVAILSSPVSLTYICGLCAEGYVTNDRRECVLAPQDQDPACLEYKVGSDGRCSQCNIYAGYAAVDVDENNKQVCESGPYSGPRGSGHDGNGRGGKKKFGNLVKGISSFLMLLTCWLL